MKCGQIIKNLPANRILVLKCKSGPRDQAHDYVGSFANLLSPNFGFWEEKESLHTGYQNVTRVLDYYIIIVQIIKRGYNHFYSNLRRENLAEKNKTMLFLRWQY